MENNTTLLNELGLTFNDYNFLMGLTGTLIGFSLLLIVILIVTNIK